LAIYAIGDVQGCFDQLQRLLERIAFDPVADKLWFAGDLVNRGPESLKTLRFVKALGDSALTVLGNHDLHLLAAAAGITEPRGKDTIAEILDAPDSADLLNWLRRQPLVHHDARLNLLLVHAGIHPSWDEGDAISAAREVQSALAGERPEEFLSEMYGNKPRRWRESLTGADRLRCITNILTRMRYLDDDGRLELKFKGAPEHAPNGLTPWFEAAGRQTLQSRIIFGHWSSLGLVTEGPALCLDSGCLWGRSLTAVRVDPAPADWVSVDCGELG